MEKSRFQELAIPNSALRLERRLWHWQSWSVRCLALAAVVLVSGCAVGPDFIQPPAPENGYAPKPLAKQTLAAGDAAGAAQRFTIGRDIPGDWWRLFGSLPLTTMIERALKNNPDLTAAQAALRVARANVAAGEGAFFPSVDGAFGASRQQTGVGSNVGLLSSASTFSLFTGQVQVSYAPDVFGGTRRSVESLQAQADNQRFQLEATYLALTANIAVAAVQEASLRGQIAETHKLIKIETDLLHLLRDQLHAGAASEVDIVGQEAALNQVEQTLPPLQRQLGQQRHLLSALTGSFPNEEPPEKFELDALRLPRDLPVSLPSQLVEQRPDIRAATESLHSASALIGVAVANRLPNVSLAATGGVNALSPDQIFTPTSGVWALGGVTSAPIFHGGTLFQREVAAIEAFDEASAQYRSVVITAFRNVADCLTALETDALALKKAVAFETAAAKTLTLTRRRLAIGEVNYLELLNAQQTYQRALITLVLARSNRFSDTAALFQALGGGWWNRIDVEPPKPRSFLATLWQYD